MRNGFTLIEIAIVLVIVGLLISGILIGQSMINTSKIQTFVRQIQQMDVAISNYQTRFNGLPGDLQGNKNGVVEDSGANGPLASVNFNNETANFWLQLNLNGFDSTKHYTSTITGTFNSDSNNPNAPAFSLGTNGSAIIFASPPEINLYLIADFSAITASNTNMSPSLGYTGPFNAFVYVDGLSLDKKMDDGNVSSGKFKVAYYNSGSYSACVQSNPKCYIQMNILSQVGQQ